MSESVRAFIGGLPTVALQHGEIEAWFDTVNKAVTNPSIRSETIARLTRFCIDLPVFLTKPGANGTIDPELIQCVTSINHIHGDVDSLVHDYWVVELVSIPRENIFL